MLVCSSKFQQKAYLNSQNFSTRAKLKSKNRKKLQEKQEQQRIEWGKIYSRVGKG